MKRQALLLAAGLLLSAQASPSSAQKPDAVTVADGRSLLFHAYMGKTRVGEHRFTFTQAAGQLVVETEIALQGRIFLIPFRYRHSSREIWDAAGLVRLESQSTTNEKKVTMLAYRSGDRMHIVDSKGHSFFAPAATLPTSWWNPAVRTAPTLLNTQTGTLKTLRRLREVPVAQGVRTELGGDATVALTYSPAQCLVGVAFPRPVDKKEIVYRLMATPSRTAAPDLAQNAILSPCLTL